MAQPNPSTFKRLIITNKCTRMHNQLFYSNMKHSFTIIELLMWDSCPNIRTIIKNSQLDTVCTKIGLYFHLKILVMVKKNYYTPKN